MLRGRVPVAARLLGAGCSTPCGALAAASSTLGRRFLSTRAQDNAHPTTRRSSTSRLSSQPPAFDQHLQRRRRQQFHTTSTQLQDDASVADPTTAALAQDDASVADPTTAAQAQEDATTADTTTAAQLQEDASVTTAKTRPDSYGTVSVGEDELTYHLPFDTAEPMRIPLLWLRDACRCPRCVDPHSGQKYFSTIDLPNKPKVRSASFTSVWGLRVVWESDNLVKSGATEADEHTGVWSKNSLISWQADHGLRTPHALSPERTLWTRDSYTALLSAGATRFSYADWNDDRGQAEFRKSLEALRDTGLIFLTGVKEHSAKKSLVYSVARKFGSPMWTFYGMQWDVKSKPHAENVAYTSQFLGLHQDLMYHDPIPRLQFLACVSNSCNGGESLFSDGVRAAYQLKLTRPDLYKVLTKPTARFHYYRHGGQSHYYERAHSTITEGEAGRVESTQWAPPFQAPFPRKADLAEWKEAAAAFEAILSAPENMFTYKLNPGDVVVFDNTRILHGRNEFRTTEGKRHLQGMYLSDQDFKLQLRLLNNSRRWEVLPDVPEFRRKVVEGELWQV